MARLYARSKGLTLVGQGVVFSVGVLPLLYTVSRTGQLPRLQAAGLYVASSAVFLLGVWIGLKFVPDRIDRAYYAQIGNVLAEAPDTPDWARFVAPLCIFGPIGAAGLGTLTAWQATVLALTLLGLDLYATGKFRLREPATELMGAVIVLLGGVIAAVPALAGATVQVDGPAWVQACLEAESAALGIAAWLGVGWLVAAVVLHYYNRWLRVEISRNAEGGHDQ